MRNKTLLIGLTLLIVSSPSEAFYSKDKVNCVIKKTGAIEEILFLKGSVLGKRNNELDLVVFGKIEGEEDPRGIFVKSSSCVSERFSIRKDLVIVDKLGFPITGDNELEIKVEPSEAGTVNSLTEKKEISVGNKRKGAPTTNRPDATETKDDVEVITISDDEPKGVTGEFLEVLFGEEGEQ